jgi:hypothetical protein
LPKPLGHSATDQPLGRAGLVPKSRAVRRFTIRLPAPRADDGIRTRDPHLGKVMRYQLRYVRAPPDRAASGPRQRCAFRTVADPGQPANSQAGFAAGLRHPGRRAVAPGPTRQQPAADAPNLSKSETAASPAPNGGRVAAVRGPKRKCGGAICDELGGSHPVREMAAAETGIAILAG